MSFGSGYVPMAPFSAIFFIFLSGLTILPKIKPISDHYNLI